MAERLKLFLENPLFVFLTVTGIVVSAVLFVLFCRNRKQDQLTRRRFLLPFVLMLVHTVLLPLAFLCGPPYIDILAIPWLFRHLRLLHEVLHARLQESAVLLPYRYILPLRYPRFLRMILR